MRSLAAISWLLCVLGLLWPVQAQALQLNGQSYLSLQEVAAKLGMHFHWTLPNSKATLSSPWSTLTFKNKERFFMLNGTKVWLGKNIQLHKNRLYITVIDYHKSLAAMLAPKASGKPPAFRHVVIDPGHGGKDVGAANTALGITEKAMTLDVAKRLKRLLEADGLRVTLTRSGDQHVGLQDRPALCNRKQADFFISIHFNSVEASSSSKAQGLETYAMSLQYHPSTTSTKADVKSYPGNRNDAWNALAAFCLQSKITALLGGEDRGIRRARFAVLKSLNCPGALVEAGFISHPREGAKIKNAAHRQKIADALYQGLKRYEKALVLSRS